MTTDIILVVYGAGASTVHAIQHLAQSTPEPRFIVVDNASPDPTTAERIERFLSIYPGQHQIVRNSENIGHTRAVNQALAMTTSDLVVWGSGDFFVCPGWYSVCEQAVRHFGASWAAPGWVNTLAYDPACLWEALLPRSLAHQWGRFGSSCALLDWKRLKNDVGTFDMRFFLNYADTDYAERMWDAGIRFVTIDGLPCIHVPQTSIKTIGVERAVDLDIADERAFHEKWADRPDVCHRHPLGADRDTRIAQRKQQWGIVE